MTQGVLYFNVGDKCLIPLCVSVMTLRRHYLGPVVLLHEGPLPPFVVAIMGAFNVWVVPTDPILEDAGCVFVHKTTAMTRTPFDVTVFLDSDTIILEDPSPLLTLAAEHETVVVAYSNRPSNGDVIGPRIEAWRGVVSDERINKALALGPGINSGVMAYRRDSAIIARWTELTLLGAKAGATLGMADEVPLQILLPEHPHFVAPERWNYTVDQGRGKEISIVHYHGRKYAKGWALSQLWKDAYWELYRAFPQFSVELSHGESRFNKWRGQ